MGIKEMLDKAAATPVGTKAPASQASVANALGSVTGAIASSPAAVSSGQAKSFITKAQDIAAGRQSNKGGVTGAIGGGLLKGLEDVGYVLGLPARAVASGIKEGADIIAGEGFSPKELVTQPFQSDFYLSKFVPKTGNKFIDFVAGTGVDIVTDPLTYVTFGASSAASRAGRIALAELAGTEAMIAKAPTLANKLDDIVRYGEYALTKAEREALNLPAGLRWQVGGGLIFNPESAAGKVSGAIAQGGGRAFAGVRARLGDTRLLRGVQEYVRPSSINGAMNNLGRGMGLTGEQVLYEIANHTSAVRFNAQKRIFKALIQGDNGDFLKALEESPFRESVYQVLDSSAARVRAGAGVAQEEQAIADSIAEILANAREEANKVIQEFNKRRGVDAYEIGFLDDYGAPRTLTQEASDYTRRKDFGNNSWDGVIAENMDITPSEFASGPAPMRMRKLQAGKEWLDGRVLQYGDIDEINAISREVLGFDWFKTDALTMLDDYMDNLAKQTGRIAFADRLLDYGPNVAKPILKKWIPDPAIVAKLDDAISALERSQATAANIVDQLGARAVDKLTKARNAIERQIAKEDLRFAGEQLSRGELISLRRDAYQARQALNAARSLAETAEGSIRQSAMEAIQPLEARVQQLERIVSSETTKGEAARLVLEGNHVRMFPNMPDDARPATVQELYDALRAGNVDNYQDRLDELAVLAAEGQDVTRKEAYATRKVEKNLAEIDKAKAEVEQARLAREAAEADLSKSQKKLETARRKAEKQVKEAMANDPAIKDVAVKEDAYKRAVAAMDSKEALAVAQDDWVNNVRPALQKNIDDINEVLVGKTKIGAETLTKDAEAARQEFMDLWRRGVGVGGSVSPIPEGVQQARTYAERLGVEYVDVPQHTAVNPAMTKEISDAYEALPSGPPPVGSPDYEAYQALRKEIKEQFNYLTKELGIKIEVSMEDPYEDAADMVLDILLNKRMKVYGDYVDHPVFTIDPETGLHENVMFRAVHDYFGHAAGGSRFDRNGEEIAFLRHIQMFSPEAGAAAASELRGQNSVLIVTGSFPEQKAYLLPEELRQPDPTMWRFVEDWGNGGGTSIDITGKEVLPNRGFVVGLGGEYEFGIPAIEVQTKSDLTDKLVAPFLSNPNVREELLKQNRWLGGWYDKDNDMFWIGVSTVIDKERDAYRALVKNNQLAAYSIHGKADVFAIDNIMSKEARGVRLTKAEQEFRDNVSKKVEAAKQGGTEAGRYRGPIGGTRSPFDVSGEARLATGGAQGEQARVLDRSPLGEYIPVADANVSQETKRIGDLVDRIRTGTGNLPELRSEWYDNANRIMTDINTSQYLSKSQREAWDKVYVAQKSAEADLSKTLGKIGYHQTILDTVTSTHPAAWSQAVDDIEEGWKALKGLGVQIPAEMEDRLFGQIKKLKTAEGLREMLSIFDRYNKFFKVTAMLTPGFIVRNAYTAAFNDFVYGCTLADVDEAIRFTTVYHRRGLRAALDSVPAEQRQLFEDSMKAVFASGAGQTREITTQPLNGIDNRLIRSKPVKLWGKYNDDAETAARLAMALRATKNGKTIDQAYADIALYHFDYGDLSRLDEVAKNFVPFWTFASRNIPLQIMNQVVRPSMYRAYDSVRRNSPVDESMILPTWLAERGPIGFGKGAVLNPDLPFIDMRTQVEQFTDPLRLLSQLYPQYKLPIELAGNRQLGLNIPFSQKGQPISGPTDLPAALVAALTGQTIDTASGPQISSKVAYAVPNAIPTLALLQRLLPELGGPEKYGERATSSRLSALTGIPYREVPVAEQQRTLRGREIALKNYLDDLQRRGYVQ